MHCPHLSYIGIIFHGGNFKIDCNRNAGLYKRIDNCELHRQSRCIYFVDIDECSNDPCQNEGNCSTLELNTFSCQCMPGYTGEVCETGK